ncbi:hypothetical protein NAD41_002360 [Salmonella enterica]|nr:hypothetical protein [Salmonella enterica]EKK6596328.1 hypothetical protein [Salmonella enterica]
MNATTCKSKTRRRTERHILAYVKRMAKGKTWMVAQWTDLAPQGNKHIREPWRHIKRRLLARIDERMYSVERDSVTRCLVEAFESASSREEAATIHLNAIHVWPHMRWLIDALYKNFNHA